MKSDIQHIQTHKRPDAHGVVELSSLSNITKALSMVMMHKQVSKQKDCGGGGGPNKKNNPRINRGDGNKKMIPAPTLA